MKEILSVVSTYSFYVNAALAIFIAYLLYKICTFRPFRYTNEPALPKLKKRDFTIQELRKYDGTSPSGRILIAVNGKVFDVTKGRIHYGPGGLYSVFAGHDASRGLATFSMDQVKDEYDDLTDLKINEMESVKEWELQFVEKYDYVGRLLKPGESPNNYSDEEENEGEQLDECTLITEEAKQPVPFEDD